MIHKPFTIVHLLYDCPEVYDSYKSIWFVNPVTMVE